MSNRPKILAKLMINEVFSFVKDDDRSFDEIIALRPQFDGVLSDVVVLLDLNIITTIQAKEILKLAWNPSSAFDLKTYLNQISSNDIDIESIIVAAINAEPNAWTDYIHGNDKASGPIMSHIIKKTQGSLNPKDIIILLKERRTDFNTSVAE